PPVLFSFSLISHQPRSPLFPYTTLFRSRFFQFMWPAEAITLAALVMIVLTRPKALPIVLPFVAAWALSPLIAFWSSRQERQDNRDRKSTRLNSSHRTISYAVFCLKKKKS